MVVCFLNKVLFTIFFLFSESSCKSPELDRSNHCALFGRNRTHRNYRCYFLRHGENAGWSELWKMRFKDQIGAQSYSRSIKNQTFWRANWCDRIRIGPILKPNCLLDLLMELQLPACSSLHLLPTDSAPPQGSSAYHYIIRDVCTINSIRFTAIRNEQRIPHIKRE